MPSGFALVITLSLMVLLAILAVGMLSLSSLALRTSSRSEAQSAARANARMALMLAIGELQKHTGPDTRVTAPSSIIDENSAPLAGAWKSWEGSDHESTGRPVVPGYASKRKAEADGAGRFLGWLVSGAGAGAEPTSPSKFASKSASGSSIPLMSTGTLAEDDDRQVHVVPQSLGEKATYAWWVSGENQKAHLPQPYKPADNTPASWSDIARSHSVADPKPFGLNALLDDSSKLPKVVSLASADFIAPADATKEPRRQFHDLSVSSIGLLTNTATGGWRKDLSLVTENWDTLNASQLPFFRISPSGGDTTSVEKPTPEAPFSKQSIFYPWSEYPDTTTVDVIYSHGAVGSWHNLKDFATAYKRISAGAGGSFSTPFTWSRLTGTTGNPQKFDYLHKIKTTPIIARVHWVFSHGTTRDTKGTATQADDTFNARLLMTPVVTMWNPYNVSITSPANLQISLGRALPCAFRYYNKDGVADVNYRRTHRGKWPTYPAGGDEESQIPGHYPPFSTVDGITYRLTDSYTFAPGETRVYSPAAAGAFGTTLNLNPGYRPGTGHFVGNVATDLDPTTPLKVDLKFDNRFKEGTATVVGVYLDMFPPPPASVGAGHMQVYRMFYTQATANAYWPPVPAADLSQPSAESVENSWQPFMSMVYGSRVSGETTNCPPGKGFIQTNPMSSFERSRFGSYAGNDHPVNASNDYSYFKHTGNDGKLPNASNDGRNRGYIISGFSAADGLSRVVLGHLPLRPMASLGELQHWDLRFQNGAPPHQIYIIGNSDASPLIAANSVYNFNPGPSVNDATNLRHDDSYCANHLLFDDWFFSSVAPEPATFGQVVATSQRERYRNFLMDHGAKPLVNRSYRPIPEDQGLTDAIADERADDILDSTDGWQRIASRLEVDGMFNVNSTSVKAWRALLGHARNQRIPYLADAGVALSGNTDHAFSRATVAGDAKAGDPGISGAQPWSSEYTGYRVFGDDLLDKLAGRIVEQVRLRGPFLSLSEFVNRQLGTDEELAVAGAIQVALNRMAADAAGQSPFKELSNPALARPTSADPPGAEAYKFRKAAEGFSTYGMPGWIRQADVLTPLAPILSARDDSFTIRAYGDSRDKTGAVIAKAWCEATVRRTRDFVDPADPADSIDTPVSAVNIAFGRRYEIIAFRWLSPDEV